MAGKKGQKIIKENCKKFKEYYIYNNIKNDTAKKYNNDVLIIWESDYNENKQNTIKNVLIL